MIDFKVLQESDAEELAFVSACAFTRLYDIPWKKPDFQKILKENVKNTGWKALESSNFSIIGFVLIQDNLDYVEILKLAVTPEYQHQGIAKSLLEKILTFCKKKNLTLEVAETNYQALSLYKKYGFKEIYRRKNYYMSLKDQTQKNDAVIMSRLWA